MKKPRRDRAGVYLVHDTHSQRVEDGVFYITHATVKYKRNPNGKWFKHSDVNGWLRITNDCLPMDVERAYLMYEAAKNCNDYF